MPKAPPITRENAREFSARANQVRWSRYREQKEQERLARIPKPIPCATPDDYRRQVTLTQLDKLDGMIDDALARKDQDSFLALASAKERLWKLVQPTAGSLRPGRSRREAPPSITAPVPISAPVAQPAPAPPAVAPASTQPPVS